ncbi:MAG: RnfABCDGE type electron transport complex subunit C [Bacillota bacterium]|nr:RnfABCDGE type electron transport complex subunit C [Bacillota bacterium]NLP22728.1 RnfABCDGE type electron transport complex subunit C [Erysipelotrichaceae bacterium]
MSILLGKMSYHAFGHKDLTAHDEIIKLEAPSEIKIPLMISNAPFEAIVKEGDKVKVGTKLGARNDHFYVPVYSPVSGVVKGIKKNMHSSLKQVDHLIIENDGKFEFEAPFEPLDFEKASHKELLEFVKEAGLVGCGGAGFPTYVKYMMPEKIDTLIINAVECEPYITSDFRGIYDNLDLFVHGVRAMFKLSGGKEGLVAIKEDKTDLIPILEEAFSSYPEIKVAKVPNVYPMGWERTLVYELVKKRYVKLPSEVGCVVSNATTAIALADALINSMPITRKLVTVSGNGIKKPANVLTYVGTPVKYLIDKCGGYNGDKIILIAGGPMMGKSMVSDQYVIEAQCNAVTVLIDEPIDEIACLRCGRCSDYCPSGLQPVRINNAEKTKDLEALRKLSVMDCIECGLCSFVCPSKIQVTEGIRKAKRYFALNNKK